MITKVYGFVRIYRTTVDSEGHRRCFSVAEHVEWLGIWEVAGALGLEEWVGVGCN